jgi:hypothetical protein
MNNKDVPYIPSYCPHKSYLKAMIYNNKYRNSKKEIRSMANINNFTCDKQLSKYTNSLLFDSGTVIAKLDMTGTCGYRAVVSLEICGEVKVRRSCNDRGEWFTTPSKFPEDIRKAIKNGEWDAIDADMCGNWFALVFSIYDTNGAEVYQDDDVCRVEQSALTPDDIETYLTECGERYIDSFIKAKNFFMSSLIYNKVNHPDL